MMPSLNNLPLHAADGSNEENHSQPQQSNLFSANAIVHEVSNVLTPALLSIEACLMSESSEQAKTQALETALKSIQQARDISEAILNLNTTSTESEWTTFNSIKADIELTSPLLPYSSASTVLISDAPTLEIKLPHTVLLRILSNLINNALSVSKGSASIVITAKTASQTPRWFHVEHPGHKLIARISVADTGPGIPEQDLPYIFDTNYSKREGGHGIGLSLCKKLVESLGARLTVNSTPGLGTVFAIEAPARDTSKNK